MSDPRATLRAVAAVEPSARGPLVRAASAEVVGVVTLLATLVLVARSVDAVFVGGSTLGDLAGAMAAVGLLAVTRFGAQLLAARDSALAADRIRRALRRTVLSAAVRPVRRAGTDARPTSTEVLGDAGDAVDAVDDYVTRFVPAVTVAALGPAIVFATVFLLDPWSSLVLLFAGPMLVFLLAVIGQRTRELTAVRLLELSWLQGFFVDLLRGLGALSACNRAGDAGDRIQEVSRRHGATTMEVLRTAFQTSLVLEWAATAATALVAVTISFRMIGGGLTFGVGLAVLVVVPEFFVPLRRLALEYHAGQSGQAAWERLAPWLQPVDAPAETAAPDRVAPLVLDGVTVRRPGLPRPALDRVSISVAPGETVALVGPSGAGKSTVLDLVLGFLAPDGGTVTAAGVDLADVDVAAWRTRLAWVPQSPTIFSGTVADNVRLGLPDRSDESVRAALRAAGAESFVEALPEGLQTPLGEGGSDLSGGQRQRIAVARAWLRDAPLVVLDEFTAHLDTDTESEVLDAAADLLAGRTAIVVAHRLRTARLADRIVVLDAGRVVGSGSHEELLGTCSTYRTLVEEHRDGRLGALAARTPSHADGATAVEP